MTGRLTEKPNRYFTFLRALRADGRTNMYGAIPYLASAFGCTREEAFRIVCEWIDSQDAAPAAATPARATSTPSRDEQTRVEPSLFDAPGAGAAAPPRKSSREVTPRKRSSGRKKSSRHRAA
jgi:hypothetical protein